MFIKPQLTKINLKSYFAFNAIYILMLLLPKVIKATLRELDIVEISEGYL